MNKNTDYKIKNVVVSTNGRNEIYFDVEWEGDENLDYFELRIREGGTDNSLELLAYPALKQAKFRDPEFLFHPFNQVDSL